MPRFSYEDPFTVLDLENTCSELDVRRAYARKLKDVRPDEDAAGFQRLVEARDLALQFLKFQSQETNTDRPSPLSDTPDVTTQVVSPSVETSAQPEAQAVSFDATPELNPAQPIVFEPLFQPRVAEVESTTPQHALAELRAGLQALTASSKPFDLKNFEFMLLHLPAGTASNIEHNIIIEMFEALRKIKTPPPLDADAVDSFERLGVMLTEFFNWDQNDRGIHRALAANDVDEFLYFLGSAHELLATGKHKRFAKVIPQVQPQASSNGWRYWILIWFTFVVLKGIFGEYSQPPKPLTLPQEIGSFNELLKSQRLNSIPISFDADTDYTSLATEYALSAKGIDSSRPYFDQVVILYVAAGKYDELSKLLDQVRYGPGLDRLKGAALERSATLWLLQKGWYDQTTCLRRQVEPAVLLPAVPTKIEDLSIVATNARDALTDLEVVELLRASDQLYGSGEESNRRAVKAFVDNIKQQLPQQDVPTDHRKSLLEILERIERCMG